MSKQDVSRRTMLKDGGATLAGLTMFQVAGPAQAFPGRPNAGRQPNRCASVGERVGVNVRPLDE